MRTVCSSVALALAFICQSVWAQAVQWPVVPLPPNVQRFEIGRSVIFNGLPMRMEGFISSATPAETANWLRRNLGQPLVEDKLDGKLILGRAQGDYYLTVQLEPAGRGTRGIVAVTHAAAAMAQQAVQRADAERLLSRFPAGSQLLSDMRSEDGGRLSRHLLLTNRHGVSLNRERVTAMLREDGFVLSGDALKDSRSSVAIANGETLVFKAPGKEAVAVIYRDERGVTAIVLNTVTSLQGQP